MGLRDRFKKGGGGFLNNVVGTIVAVAFTTEPGWANTAGRLYFRVDVRKDGAEEPESTHLDAGFAKDITIAEDGLSITEDVDGALWRGTSFTRFYSSLVEKGFADVEGEVVDMSSLVGVRANFIQVKDEEKMTRDAKTYKKSKGAVNEKGQRKGKDGKYYDQRSLEVSEIFESAEVEEAPATKTRTTKPATKTASPAAKPAVKGKTVAPKADDTDALRDFTKDVVIEVLTAAKGKVMKTSLSTGIVKRFSQEDLKGDSRREDVRKVATDDDFIAEMVKDGLITFEKNQLALA